MQQNLTVAIPFWNGHDTIDNLLDSLPDGLRVIVVDDHSDKPFQGRDGVEVVKPPSRGYFTGAANYGIEQADDDSDVLILNQDVVFTGDGWLKTINANRDTYGLIGERIEGHHPVFVNGYIHGTFMYIRRDVIEAIGLMDAEFYPHWGSTAAYQLAACRAGFRALPLHTVPGFTHLRDGGYGTATTEALRREPDKRSELVRRTKPDISVIITCHNYGRYLQDAINSLVGGQTSLGDMPGQTFQGFEVIIVDDASTDDSWQIAQSLVDPWKNIRAMRLKHNGGTPAALNAGVRHSHGRWITHLCADDMMEPYRLREMLRLAVANPHSVIYDNLTVFSDGERRGLWAGKGLPDYDFERLLHKNGMHTGILMPRIAYEEVGGWNEQMRDGREDWQINVALGLKGYCGVRLEKPGYLYRREKQNRTLTNTTGHWPAQFLNQMKSLYPRVYQGERPMGCCGNEKGQAMQLDGAKVPLEDGVVTLKYVGGNAGRSTWWGEATGTQYRVTNGELFWADPDDARAMLQSRKWGRVQFELFEAPPDPEPIRREIEVAKPPPVHKAVVAPLDPGDFTLPDLREALNGIEATGDQIEAMLDLEKDGKNRTGAMDFIGGEYRDRVAAGE